MKITYYVATSLDGFIARSDGSTDLLEPVSHSSDHYLNFKDYITIGDLSNLVDLVKFNCFKTTRILLDNVIFSVYRKH